MASAALTDAQLWSVVTGAGWSGQDALTAFAVALAESGGNPSATNKNTNGSTDYGLFQINSVHASLLQGKAWNDPAVNAAMAKTLYDGQRFKPWVTYNTGAYVRFLARAQSASKSGGAAVTIMPVDNKTAAGSDFNAKVANATSGDTYKRIGMFAVGAIFIIIVAVSIIKNTSVGKAVAHTAKTAAKVAAI